jgi:diguanylate cyclase (GGDEF)-like protein
MARQDLTHSPGETTQQSHVKSFVMPVVPWIMAASAIGMGVNWSVQWSLRRAEMGPIMPILGAAVVVMLATSWAIRSTAAQGRVNWVGLLGIIFVMTFSGALTLVTYRLGGGVRYALSYSALLICVAAFFWPRSRYFLVGTLLALAPPIALLLTSEEDSRIRFSGLQFALNSFLLSAGTYWIVRQANDRIAQLTSEITYRATHDGLTGVMNRTYWMDRATEELGQASRSGQPASVMVIDLDHFKELNDEQGHDAGDRFLVLVAQVLQQGTPRGSLIGRLGGDEFIAFLPRVALTEAEGIATALHRDLRLLSGPDSLLTMSIGVAERQPAGVLDQLIAEADQAMFAAKRGGRDTTRSGLRRSRPRAPGPGGSLTMDGFPGDAQLEANGGT